MHVRIEYCRPRGYETRAHRARALLEEKGVSEFDLVPGGPGQFDITIDGALVLSRRDLGRFPEESEISALVT